MFAVIRTGGKQYKVAKNDVIRVERLPGEAGSTLTLDEVLMLGDGETVTVGAPTVDGASVAAEVVAEARGPKLVVFKKRRRKNSRRKNGHRQDISILRITDILTGGAKPAAKAKAEKPKAEPKEEAAETAPLFTAPEGAADDLKKISGVGPVLEKKLHALGITQYAQIAAFTADEIARVDEVLNFKGRIEREDWVSQAKALAAGEAK
ncbi:MAG: 50S ribosomal protein L21 [Alphaproteobacteria bacterium]|nr:50S ribosomal protein L21 [Alphaproteobacteria bacterium]